MQPLPQIPLTQTNPEHLDALLKLREILRRNRQFGKGIVAGLELGLGANQGISIGKGFGFTSCGLPIDHEDSIYTHFTPYTPPPHPPGLSDLLPIEGIVRGKPYLEKEVFKLLTEEEKHAIPLGKFENLAEYVVILFLEAEVIKGDKNEQEPVLEFKVIPLLVPMEDPVFEDQLPGLYFFQQRLRFNPRKGEIGSGNDILVHFLELISNGHLYLLQDNLVRVWDFYAPMLYIKEDNPFSSIHLEGLLASFKSDSRLRIMAQYLVDFIEDLCRAFTEFLEKAKAAIDTGQLDPFPFPLHLALGPTAKGVYGNENKYRHSFQQNTFTNAPPNILKEAAFLLRRLGIMASAFDWVNMEESNKVIVTPSMIGNVETAARAIPIYYDWHRLKDFWKFTNKVASFPYHHPMGYFSEYEMNYPSWVNRPLDYDLEPYNFFRIEGHIGMDFRMALHRLTYFQTAYSLPFHILALSASDFVELLNDKTKGGLAHKAGVNIGGTFILVFNDQRDSTEPPKKAYDPESNNYGEIAQALRHLKMDLGEHGEKVLAALDQKHLETEDKEEWLPQQVVIADFYLPFFVDYPQPDYPKPTEIQQPIKAPKLNIDLIKREFCETEKESYKIKVHPEGGKLFLDGKEFTAREFIPSEIGAGKHQLTYEMDGIRESLSFVISKSIKPSIAIHHLDFSEIKGWDIGFCNHPTLSYPMEWQLEQYHYNDEYKDSSGIFKRHFNPNAGEIGLSLQIHNPSPCHTTHTRKKLLFEQYKESLCESKGNFSCSLVRKLPIKTLNQPQGIQLEDNIITINKEFTKGKNEILIPLYQETESEFIFTLVKIQVLNASFQLTCKSGHSDGPDNIILSLSPINQDGHSKWEINGITHQNGQEILLAISQLQKTLSITHTKTSEAAACQESLTVEVKVKEILEVLEGNGIYSKNFST